MNERTMTTLMTITAVLLTAILVGLLVGADIIDAADKIRQLP